VQLPYLEKLLNPKIRRFSRKQLFVILINKVSNNLFARIGFQTQVWTVGRPVVRSNDVRHLSLQQLDGITGAMCRSAVLLEDKCVVCYLSDGWNHLLREQDIAVVLAINLNSGVDKHQLSHTHF